MSCRCSSGIIKRALKEGTENVLSFNFTEVFMDKDILKKGLESEKIELNDKQEKDFETFSGLLTEWNKKMNLTAVTDPAEISVKHFLDSIVPAFKAEIKENSKIIDVGTGAGFPGVPIKIMRRDLDFTFLDSLNKRITFLNEVSSVLGFEKAEFIHGRAEELGRNPKYREKFDYAVSRAVAPLRILAEYCIPFLKKGGILISDNILYKGMTATDELVVRRKVTIVRRLRKYLEMLKENRELCTAILPIGDGVAVSFKE